MSYFRECPFCGDLLYPGERCDCQEQEEQERRKLENMVKCGSDGQYIINFNHRSILNTFE